MKKQTPFYLIIFFLLGFSQLSVAQADLDNLNKDLDVYEDLLLEKDFDSLMYYVHPKIFEILPKETFVTLFSSMFESEELQIELNEFTRDLILEVQNIDSNNYSFVEYGLQMKMIFEDGFEDDEAKEMMQNIMSIQYGKDNVEVGDNYVTVKTKNAMFAEYIEDRWTFVTYKSDQKAMMNMIIPEEIQEKILKARYSDEKELKEE